MIIFSINAYITLYISNMDFGFDMNTEDSIDDFDIVDLDNEGYFGKTHYLGIPVLICKRIIEKGYKKGMWMQRSYANMVAKIYSLEPKCNF